MTVFRIRQRRLGAHVSLSVFAGPDGDHLALTGQLTMLPVEAIEFAATLYGGGEHCGPDDGRNANEPGALTAEIRARHTHE